jgi:hypothetical protein
MERQEIFGITLEEICDFQSKCTRRAGCRYHHPKWAASLCIKHFKYGNCKFGMKCALVHTTWEEVAATATYFTSMDIFKSGNRAVSQPRVTGPRNLIAPHNSNPHDKFTGGYQG